LFHDVILRKIFIESLIKKQGTPLSPDRIRDALSKVHTSIFEDIKSKNLGKMDSALPENALKIFEILNIKKERLTMMN